jgi:hypothetical protein
MPNRWDRQNGALPTDTDRNAELLVAANLQLHWHENCSQIIGVKM